MTGPDGRPLPDGAGPAEYPPRVDPWATAEASAGGHGHLPPPTWRDQTSGPEPWMASTHEPGGPPPTGRPAYRRSGFLIVTAAVVIVVGVAATLVVRWQRSTPALDYTTMTEIGRVAPAVPLSSGFADTHVVGDRTYLASAGEGPLEVVAVTTRTGEEIWRNTAAGRGRWDHIVGLGDKVAAFTDTDLNTDTRRMVVLGGAKGDKLWDRTIGARDTVLFAGDRAVVAEHTEGRVIGLVLDTGKVRWEHANPKRTSSGTTTTTTALYPVTTDADLTGPAGVGGAAFAPDRTDDQRIVQIGADRSARVIDASTGAIGGSRANVADPDDPGGEIIAHDGRLLVATNDEGYRIFAYDLDRLGEPRTLLTAPGSDRALGQLTPCGDDRVCLLETTGYDAATTQLVAVDADATGELWRTPVPGAKSVVPVGESVLVSGAASPVTTTLVDAKGELIWDRRDGSAARVDAGNVLLFDKPPTPYADDSSVWGDHLGEDPVSLGPLADTRAETCSWNDAVIACAAANDFVLRRFAG